ncbi:MAG: DUF6468 domain-containing protein [Bosea sp. (in: a-proteobacteria)]
MSPMISFAADVLVGILLVATIASSVVLAKRIERLKSDETAMRQTIRELLGATDAAERAIAGLKLTVGDSDRTLAERLRTAERYAAELTAQVEAGQGVLDRISQIVEAANKIAGAGAPPSPANETATKLASTADMAGAIAQRAITRLNERAA